MTISLSSFANLNQFVKEYLSTSNEIKSSSFAYEYQKLLLELELDKRPLVFSLASEKSTSNLITTPLNLNPTEEKTMTHSASLSKDFIWGGEFSITGSLYDYDAASDYKSFSQEVSYTQDIGRNFFGRNEFLSKEVKQLEVTFQDKTFDNIKSKSLLDFIAKYIDVKKEVTFFELQKQALDRAQRRLKLIKRQVKDGLKERVDLYSSESGYRYQKEQVEQKRASLLVAKKNFETKLERNVSLDSFPPYEVKKLRLEEVPAGEFEDNFDIQAIKSKLIYLEKNYESADNSVFPIVKLSASYKTNSINTAQDSPISDGSFGADNSAKAIGLTVSIPIGFDVEKNARSQANLAKMKAEYDYKLLKVQVMKKIEQIKVRLLALDRNIDSVADRYELSKKTVDEYNKLYNKGRANLDTVLRAEEELIQTEQAFVQYNVQRELEVYSLYDLYGKLVEKVTK
ncbi:outer membrane efflux protein [Bacteriovorax sp. Seq25_V]|nr:outer membrane efflux protein [Bacteriovorax sp. Seq25_V]